MVLDWDEPGVPCPVELAYIWNGVQSGARRLDLKQVLDSIPRFTGLPSKPPENNFRGESNRRDDKERKAWQQSLLHALQLLAAQYSAVKANVGKVTLVQFQQCFELLSEVQGNIGYLMLHTNPG